MRDKAGKRRDGKRDAYGRAEVVRCVQPWLGRAGEGCCRPPPLVLAGNKGVASKMTTCQLHFQSQGEECQPFAMQARLVLCSQLIGKFRVGLGLAVALAALLDIVEGPAKMCQASCKGHHHWCTHGWAQAVGKGLKMLVGARKGGGGRANLLA